MVLHVITVLLEYLKCNSILYLCVYTILCICTLLIRMDMNLYSWHR